MNYPKSYQNRANNDQGKMFEEMILGGCRYYREIGIAEIDRTPEPFRVLKLLTRGQFTGQFTGKAQPDFQGTLEGGKSIAFEAKYTSSDRIKQSVLTDYQSERLAMHHQMGAAVGVCCGIGRTYGFVPWPIWEQMKRLYGRKYMTESELKQFAVKTPGYIAFLDKTVQQ